MGLWWHTFSYCLNEMSSCLSSSRSAIVFFQCVHWGCFLPSGFLSDVFEKLLVSLSPLQKFFSLAIFYYIICFSEDIFYLSCLRFTGLSESVDSFLSSVLENYQPLSLQLLPLSHLITSIFLRLWKTHLRLFNISYPFVISPIICYSVSYSGFFLLRHLFV